MRETREGTAKKDRKAEQIIDRTTGMVTSRQDRQPAPAEKTGKLLLLALTLAVKGVIYKIRQCYQKCM